MKRIIASAMALAILITTGLVIVRNRQLRAELDLANQLILSLQAGALHQGAAAPSETNEVFDMIVLNRADLLPSLSIRQNNTAPPAATCSSCSRRVTDDPLSTNSFDGSMSSLLDIRKTYDVGTPSARFTLFIFFSPTDCPACLTEARTWQKLSEEHEALGLDVIGIVDRTSKEEASKILQQLGIGFPVLLDTQSTLRTKYRLQNTPAKILVGNLDGKIILTSSGNPTPEAQAEFARAVRAKG